MIRPPKSAAQFGEGVNGVWNGAEYEAGGRGLSGARRSESALTF